MSKFIDLVYALAWWAYQKLHSFLGVTNPVVYKDRPETQETLARLVADNDALVRHNSELTAENDELRAEAVAYANLIVKEEYGKPKSGPNRPNNNRKLTDAEVKEIRELKRAGWKNVDLADTFDVNRATISRIVRNQYHKSA